jgi:hypothetical protein
MPFEQIDEVVVEPIAVIWPLVVHVRELVVAQQFKVMLHGGTADAELDDDHLLDVARVVFTAGEYLDNPTPNRLGHHLVHMHDSTVSIRGDVSAN